MRYEIKPLEWRPVTDNPKNVLTETILGTIQVCFNTPMQRWLFLDDKLRFYCYDSMEAAKAAALGWYRNRLASALTPASGESGLRTALELILKAASEEPTLLPKRVDAMNEIEHAIFVCAAEAHGTVKFIRDKAVAALANPDGGGEDADAAFMLSIGGRETTSEDDCPTRFVIEHGGFSVGLVCDMHEADLVVNDHFVKGYPTKQDVLDLCRIVGIPVRSSP